MHLDQITAVSRLEADIITMVKVVEDEEKKRLESLREKVEDIIEEEKEKDLAKKGVPPVDASTPTKEEIKENIEKESELEAKGAKEKTSTEEVSEKEKELVEEVLRKEATAPPVTPLPPSNEEVLAGDKKKSTKKDKSEKQEDEVEVLTHVSNEGKAESKAKAQGKDMEQ